MLLAYRMLYLSNGCLSVSTELIFHLMYIIFATFIDLNNFQKSSSKIHTAVFTLQPRHYDIITELWIFSFKMYKWMRKALTLKLISYSHGGFGGYSESVEKYRIYFLAYTRMYAWYTKKCLSQRCSLNFNRSLNHSLSLLPKEGWQKPCISFGPHRSIRMSAL